MSWFIQILNKVAPNRIARLSRRQIMDKYGEPDERYQIRYCYTWYVQSDFKWFPAKRIFINKEFKDKLYQAFTRLELTGLYKEIRTFDGCFEIRNTRGSSLPSLHSWALAIDLNASLNKLGQTIPNWSNEFLEVMRTYVYCGADFISRSDAMHFSLYGE